MAAAGEHRFRATLSDGGRGGGRWVEVPSEVREAFGEAQPQVEGEANGVALRSRLAVRARDARVARGAGRRAAARRHGAALMRAQAQPALAASASPVT
ncbi:MAG: hypothetical protein ABSH27_12795 [Solirubrobacteraceae bacterium]|jgi:hypothetical protein